MYKTPCLIYHYVCFELGHEGEIYFHVCLQGTLEWSVRNKILPVEARWPRTHRLNDRRHRLRQSVFSVSWIMCLYYNLFGTFNKLNFLKPPKNKMHFTVFILWYYFTVFTNWMNFWFVLPRLLFGFSKMSIHEFFLVVLTFLL